MYFHNIIDSLARPDCPEKVKLRDALESWGTDVDHDTLLAFCKEVDIKVDDSLHVTGDFAISEC